MILEILRKLAFISARFGYSAFDEWNFVYLASIDLLSSNPLQTTQFVERHIPGISPLKRPLIIDPSIRHPCAKADSLYFLDTLEHLVPILPPSNIHAILPIVRGYLQPQAAARSHLESAHSVFLAILARGDIILHDQIQPYTNQVYNVPLLLQT